LGLFNLITPYSRLNGFLQSPHLNPGGVGLSGLLPYLSIKQHIIKSIIADPTYINIPFIFIIFNFNKKLLTSGSLPAFYIYMYFSVKSQYEFYYFVSNYIASSKPASLGMFCFQS